MLAGLDVTRVRAYAPGAPWDDATLEKFLARGSREVERAMLRCGVTLGPDNVDDLLDAASAYVLHFAQADDRGAADASGDAPIKKIEEAGTKIEFAVAAAAPGGATGYGRDARRLLALAGCVCGGAFPGASA